MRLNNVIFLLGILLTSSCIDRFIPDTTRYDETLFVECLISDDTTTTRAVHISISAPVATQNGGKITSKPQGLSGATAKINCTDGNSYNCTETTPGSYAIPGNFKVKYGNSYKLIVQSGVNIFESDYQQLNPTTLIDSISYRHVLKKRSEDGVTIDGYRFYASTHDTGKGPSFYRWSLDATFQYTVPYLATHIWDGRTQIPETNRLIRTCWKSKNIDGIYIAKTTGLTENRVTEAPLNFESQYGDELTIRYSLNVKQYSISQSAFTFWENMDKLVNQTGGLYETQPFRIEGNIHCTSDPSLYVAGIFEVASVSTLRTFVNRPAEFPVTPVICILDTVGTVNFPWYRLPAGSYVTQDYQSKVFLTATPSCYDCRLRDGTLEKPPFWKNF